MQTARCLCNFPPAPAEKTNSVCNNNGFVLLMKSNSAWLEFQRFFTRPEDPRFFVWAKGQDCPGELVLGGVGTLFTVVSENQ